MTKKLPKSHDDICFACISQLFGDVTGNDSSSGVWPATFGTWMTYDAESKRVVFLSDRMPSWTCAKFRDGIECPYALEHAILETKNRCYRTKRETFPLNSKRDIWYKKKPKKRTSI